MKPSLRLMLRSGLSPKGLFSVLAMALVLATTASAQERMYAVKYPGLWDLDPVTGAALGWKWSGPPSASATQALTTWNHRLLNIGCVDLNVGLQSVWIHPADASTTGLGALPNTGWSIESHPVTGVVYCMGGSPFQLFTLDPLSGQMTHVAYVSSTNYPRSFAIRLDGVAYVLMPGRFLGTIDLSTGIVTLIGMVQTNIPPGLQYGYFADLAFDRQGQLWGAWWVGNIGGWGVLYNGLYKIDIANLTATRVQAFNEAFGIAFGPDCTCTTYCTGKQNGAGCVPTIAREGLPSPTAQWGFEITATNVVNQTAGTLAWSVAGRAANPFHNGTWCVRSPLKRTPLQSSGGSTNPYPDCSGSWSLDFNTYLQSNGLLPAGTTVDCQWYGRDPGLPPPHNVQLSNALEFVLMP